MKRLIQWELAGFLWTSAAGTLLHFVYEWSGGDFFMPLKIDNRHRPALGERAERPKLKKGFRFLFSN